MKKAVYGLPEINKKKIKKALFIIIPLALSVSAAGVFIRFPGVAFKLVVTVERSLAGLKQYQVEVEAGETLGTVGVLPALADYFGKGGEHGVVDHSSGGIDVGLDKGSDDVAGVGPRFCAGIPAGTRAVEALVFAMELLPLAVIGFCVAGHFPQAVV